MDDAERTRIVKSFLALLVEEPGVEKLSCTMKSSIKESAEKLGESNEKIELLLLKKFRQLFVAFLKKN